MQIDTLLMKMMAKSMSLYALMGNSFFLCGLLLKSAMEQLQVCRILGCGMHSYTYIHACMYILHQAPTVYMAN